MKGYKTIRITEEMHARLLDSLGKGKARRLGEWIEEVLEKGLIEIELK